MALNIQLTLVVLAALISLAFGVRYFISKAYMPYHAVVAGKSWAEVDPRMQTVILGLFKIAAAVIEVARSVVGGALGLLA
jgi:hypothetical protein